MNAEESRDPSTRASEEKATQSASGAIKQVPIVDKLEPYTWSTEESVAYEAAIEAIGRVIGIYSEKISIEEAMESPDPELISNWVSGQRQCVERRRVLDPTNHEDIARVRREYTGLAQRLRHVQ